MSVGPAADLAPLSDPLPRITPAELQQVADAVRSGECTLFLGAGAHSLRGKGSFAYQEALHLPFHVVHPDVQGGQQCRAVTSHIDVVPTVLSLAGANATKRAEVAGRTLPGKDLAPVIAAVLPSHALSPYGREAQSIAFFNTPGIE